MFSRIAVVNRGEPAMRLIHAVRERKAEHGTAIRVRALHYEGSQAWPYPGSLMLGFTAVADRAASITVDPEEITEARWFTRVEIAQMMAGDHRDPETGVRLFLPMRASIALYLIKRWLGDFPAPIL